MKTLKKLFQLKLNKREVEIRKKIMSILMIPLFVLQMCSTSLLLTQTAIAADDEAAVQVAAEESSDEPVEKKDVNKEEAIVENEEVTEAPEEAITPAAETISTGESQEEVIPTEATEGTVTEATDGAVEATEPILNEQSTEVETAEIATEEVTEPGTTEKEPAVDETETEAAAETADIKTEDVLTEPEIIETTLFPTETKEEPTLKELISVAEPEWEISDNGKTAEIGPVDVDVTYKAPQNSDVTVTFTKLPENPGNLRIEEITLTEQQMIELGALSDKAYDITSDMENGTFTYDLTLPKPEDANEVKIKYSEEKSDLYNAKTIDDIDVKNDKVEAEGINHFTIFFIVSEINQTKITVTPHVYTQGQTVFIKADSFDSGYWWFGFRYYYYKLAVNAPGYGNIYDIGNCVRGDSSFLTANYSLVAPNNITPGDWAAELYRYTNSSCTNDKIRVQTPADFTVTAGNRAPVANNQNVSTNVYTAKSITLVATDADSNPMTYSIETYPLNGSLTGTAPNVIYTPTANYYGSDSFTFKANDGTVDSNIATVSITILDNVAPTGGSIDYADGLYTIASIPISYSIGSDAESGMNIASGRIQRASATLSNGICGSFGSFSNLVTESDGLHTDNSVTDKHCYKYRYLIADNKGNTATYVSANVAKVSTTGSLRIIKDALPNDDQNFTFSSTLLGGFTLDDDGNNNWDRSSYKDFEALTPGTYQITENSVNGWDLGSINCVTDGQWAASGATLTIDILANETAICTFQNTKQGSIDVFKFNDLNGNGSWDIGEGRILGIGMNGWQINLYSGYDCTGPAINQEITDGIGDAEFYNLAPGQYSLSETQQDGWAATTSACVNTEITPGDHDHVYFGNQRRGSIKVCKVIIDANNNIIDGSGIPAETFTINWNNGLAPSVFDSGQNLNTKIFNSSEGNDAYCIDYPDLTIDDYQYSQESIGNASVWGIPRYNDQFITQVNSLNDFYNYNSNQDSNGDINLALAAGPDRTLVILNQYIAGSISGYKWNDNNGNGVNDSDDEGLTGWTIFIDSNDNQLLDDKEQSTTTDYFGSDPGYYSFNNLTPGNYSVCEVEQKKWARTYPAESNCQSVIVNAGQNIENVNFGNALLGTIHGYKWSDLNGDGIPDNDEPLLSGWNVFIDANLNGQLDDGEMSMETSDSQEHFGWYWFEDLMPGTYQVCEVQQDGWRQTFPSQSTCYSINLPDGNSYGFPESLNAVSGPEYNFGNQQLGKITVAQYFNRPTVKSFLFATNYQPDFKLANGESNTSSFLTPPGAFTIYQHNNYTDWNLGEVSCVDSTQNSQFLIIGRTITVSLAPGGNVTCTYNNKHYATDDGGGGGGAAGGVVLGAATTGGGAGISAGEQTGGNEQGGNEEGGGSVLGAESENNNIAQPPIGGAWWQDWAYELWGLLALIILFLIWLWRRKKEEEF
jgi:hypothetical protein